MPSGLTLNQITGVISGTPTQAIGVGVNVTMQLPGYQPAQVLSIINIAP